MLLKSSYTPAEIRHLLSQEESRNRRFYNARLERYCDKISRVMARNKWREVNVFFRFRGTTKKFPPRSMRINAYNSCIYDLCDMLHRKGFSVSVEVTSEKGRDFLNVSV